MIKSVESGDRELIYCFCDGDILGTKISCLLKAYGVNRDFLSAWYLTENKNVTAVICSFYGNITLLMRNCSSFNDIRMFTDMLGYESLCLYEHDAVALGFKGYTSKKAFRFNGGQTTELVAENISEEHYKEVYRLISRNIPDSFKDDDDSYLSFLSDFTFRKRRNLARMKGIISDDRIVSCALTSAETEKAAIISGIACDKSFRERGLGRKTVLSLSGELSREGKTVFVIALNESAEGFYEHIGFNFENKISFVERK